MNTIKKVLSLLLVGAMIFSFAACHPKDEVALTIGDVEITSALYMYALINADGEAMTKVDEAKAEEKEDTSSDAATSSDATSSATSSTTEATDYHAEEIDGKSYSDWVKDRAIELCTEFAAYETLCKENDLSLSDDAKEEADYYAQYYWSYYGYQGIYEPNGVSFDTFKKGFTYSYLFNEYFEFVYGEGGEKAVPADEVTKTMSENFVIADVLQASTADLDETKLAELKGKFDGYMTRLENGEEFEKIYNEYYEIKEDATTDATSSATSSTDDTSSASTESTASTDSSATSSTEEEEKELEPKDPHATLLGSEDTDYANDLYETAKAMAVGEIKLIEDAEAKTISIVIKGDVMADEYWTENLNTPTLSLLKMDEFEKDVEEYAKTLTVKKNSYAVNQFKVKKIDYSNAYAGQ